MKVEMEMEMEMETVAMVVPAKVDEQGPSLYSSKHKPNPK